MLRLLAEVYLTRFVGLEVEGRKLLDDILVGLLHVLHLLTDDVVVLEVHNNLVDAIKIALRTLGELWHLACRLGLLLFQEQYRIIDLTCNAVDVEDVFLADFDELARR